MSRYFRDLTGQRFGKVVALHRHAESAKNGSVYWECLCDCGNTKKLTSKVLTTGKASSCGCLQTININFSYEKEIIRRYRYGAINKGHSWNLTDEMALSLIRSPCYYCGEVGMRARRNKRNPSNTALNINGIDRMNSDLGYEVDNVVPCCSRCNFRKREIPYDEFLEWIKIVYEHMNLGEING